MAFNYEYLGVRLRVMSLNDLHEEYKRLRDPLLEDGYFPEEKQMVLQMYKSELFRRLYGAE